MTTVRQLALDLLIEWENSDAFADVLLSRLDKRQPLRTADRAFLQALVFGVLRHASILDYWIDQLRERGRLRSAPRWILRLGLLQLLFLDVPAHAGVNETVRLAGREKSFINAILRRALREKDHLFRLAAQVPSAIRHSLPEFLVRRWIGRFGPAHFERLAETINQPAEVFVRLNRLKPEAKPPPGADEIDWPHDFFRVKQVPHELLQSGDVYVQDPSTALAPSLLAPRPGETVLDAFAAPGGKTAILAQIMENSGRLLATDIAEPRLARLRENLKRLGATCAEVQPVDWTQPAPAHFPRCDAVLLDLPCSNTGVMRRRVDVRWRVTEQTISRMADTQLALARHIVPLLKPGGRLVYSTCSIEPEENEDQVARIEQQFPQMRLIESRLLLPHQTGFDGGYAALFRTER